MQSEMWFCSGGYQDYSPYTWSFLDYFGNTFYKEVNTREDLHGKRRCENDAR